MRPNSSARTKFKLPLGLGLAVLVVAAAVVVPTVATARSDEAAPVAAATAAAAGHAMAGHDMGALETAALEDELAQVRRVTARVHAVDAALAAGYELGWVNGSGVRIITGCVFHPTAGAMATTTSTRS